MKNADMPAIPFEEVRTRIAGHTNDWTNHKGMTKREMIAMHCAAAAFGSSAWVDAKNNLIAEQAVEMADALLAELERTRGAE